MVVTSAESFGSTEWSPVADSGGMEKVMRLTDADTMMITYTHCVERTHIAALLGSGLRENR